MGRVEIDWAAVFGGSSPVREGRICLGRPSSAPQAAAKRAGSAAAKRAPAGAGAGAGAGAEGVAKASSDDEKTRGTQDLHLRLEARLSELERRVGELRPGERSPVTRASPKAAADRGLDACSAAVNVHTFNQEDKQGEHVACKSCLKPSPVLVRRKKDHEQADRDRKRFSRPAAKNDDKEPAPPEEIFEVLREIPSLERADLLTAYSTLIRDDRLFRSLMALPTDMRKDWLLMEIGNQ